MNSSDIANERENTVEALLEPEPPHEALFLVLAYLPLYELLAMSEVCRSLRDAVDKDILPWLDIIVERPLTVVLSDDILMKVASRANGRLRTLALINCVKITDDGLQQVVQRNLLIEKLFVPGCTGLTPDGVIKAVKTLSEHNHSLQTLQINGIYNIQKHHLTTLLTHLETNRTHRATMFKHEEDRRLADVEVCPKCDEVRLVLDCQRKRCKFGCRGCRTCFQRCEECGACVEYEEPEEAACADVLCSDCWLLLPKCSFCNKPYCKKHASLIFASSGSGGFVCDACHERFIRRNSYDYDDD